MWVESVVGSLICSERFFSGYSGFPLYSNLIRNQVDEENSVDVLTPNHYLSISYLETN